MKAVQREVDEKESSESHNMLGEKAEKMETKKENYMDISELLLEFPLTQAYMLWHYLTSIPRVDQCPGPTLTDG